MTKVLVDEEILKYAFVFAFKSENPRIYVPFCQNVEAVLPFLSSRFLRGLILTIGHHLKDMSEEDRIYWRDFYRTLNNETKERMEFEYVK